MSMTLYLGKFKMKLRTSLDQVGTQSFKPAPSGRSYWHILFQSYDQCDSRMNDTIIPDN